VLDVGCGVGRSTRLLIEFGLRPENIMGIDLRSSAIEHARRLNPAIPFRTVNSLDDWPLELEFDLCMQCTVFSSIPGVERRRLTARMMAEAVGNKGFIFGATGIALAVR
jgi:trans-aconitate methyltransferase